jgi:hypothetical protein
VGAYSGDGFAGVEQRRKILLLPNICRKLLAKMLVGHR